MLSGAPTVESRFQLGVLRYDLGVGLWQGFAGSGSSIGTISALLTLRRSDSAENPAAIRGQIDPIGANS